MEEPTKSQYHHFVPRVLLKNFSHEYKPPKIARRRKKRYEKGMYPGDSVVRHVDLTVPFHDPYVIREKPLARILGRTDMYRDTSKPSPVQKHIEKLLSKLESQASAIFHKITRAFALGDPSVCLNRHERDVLRKFLFIMKYRGSAFHHRFYHDTLDTYDSDDRQSLLDYMKEKGYERPLDVWFDNLKAVIDLKMDPEKQWISEIKKKMFPDDAAWFVAHAQFQYMAICTPEDAGSEFILTDNSYNIFEGPNTFVTDKETGNLQGACYAPLHEFAPLSPKLMIVFRSVILPVPEEDHDKDLMEWREEFRKGVFEPFAYEVKSLLADLPITKQRNNYSTIVDGKVYLDKTVDANGFVGKRDHKYFFRFFPIGTRHVNVINGLLFDNAHQICTSIVFESETAFKSTLEWFITAPPDQVGKHCMSHDDDTRLGYLRKLEVLLGSLGSNEKLAFRMLPSPLALDYDQYLRAIYEQRKSLSQLEKHMADIPDSRVTKAMESYLRLGGNKSTVVWDLKQSHLMWKLRVKIDCWSQGLDENLRARNRRLLVDAYLRLPPRRVYLFANRMRLEFLRRFQGERSGHMEQGSDDPKDNPENVIARVSKIVSADKLSKLLYHTALNSLEIRTKLETNLGGGGSFISTLMQTMLRYRITFQTPGYIRDCGIVPSPHFQPINNV